MGRTVCAECGFQWHQAPDDIFELVRSCTDRVALTLAAHIDHIANRPNESTWSMKEYAAHLAQALAWYATRLERIEREHHPHFGPHDWDRACQEGRYNERDVDTILADLDAATGHCTAALTTARAQQWSRSGVGSDGTPRSSASQALRAGHEIVHHLHDLHDVASRVAGPPQTPSSPLEQDTGNSRVAGD